MAIIDAGKIHDDNQLSVARTILAFTLLILILSSCVVCHADSREVGDGGPVILSTSQYNLVSMAGQIARGKIFVKNGTGIIQKFNIEVEYPIEIDKDITQSTCFDNVAAGGTCVFAIAYRGREKAKDQAQLKIKVTASDGSYDSMQIRTMGVPAEDFFDPTLVNNNKRPVIEREVSGVVALKKRGVELLFALTVTEPTPTYGSFVWGVLKSTDGGQTWMKCGANATGSGCLYVDGINGDLYVVESGKISKLKIFDGGSDWQVISFPLDKSGYLESILAADGQLYIGGYKGVLGSSDGGKTWVGPGVGIQGQRVNCLQVMDGTLYAAVMDGVIGAAGIYKSSDKGNNWIFTGSPVASPYWNNVLAVGGGNLYAAAGKNGIMKTNDGGVTWALISNTGLQNVRGLYIDGSILYCYGEYGIGKSTDGGLGWINILPNDISIPNVAYARDIRFFCASSSGAMLAVSDYLNILLEGSDGGMTWKILDTINAGNFGPVSAMLKKDGIAYVGTDEGVFKSRDDGENWEVFPGTRGVKISNLYLLDATMYAVGQYSVNGKGVVMKLLTTDTDVSSDSGDSRDHSIKSLSSSVLHRSSQSMPSSQSQEDQPISSSRSNIQYGSSSQSIEMSQSQSQEDKKASAASSNGISYLRNVLTLLHNLG